jgi:hypothetical protein
LYAPVFHLIPFEEDNVYVLAWAAATPAGRILAVDPSYYPEWRPLAYATVWAEQHLGAPITLHVAVNLALWIGCALLVYRLTRAIAQSQLAALLAALLVVSDPRATWTIVAIVERQTSLACAFGLLAVFVVLALESRVTTKNQAALALLLIASMLSKEYGASFTVAIAAYGIVGKRRELWLPASIAAATYIVVRLAVVGVIVQPYCEEMYFFGSARDVCVDVLQPSSWPQLAYNAAATLINLPLLGLFSGVGAPILAESRLATGIVFSALAAAAIVKGPRIARLLPLIAVANAAVSVMIYRDRNQLAGACALAVLAGIGLRPAFALMTPRVMRTAAAAAVVALLAAQAVLARSLLAERIAIASQIEPCRLEIMDRPFVPPYVASLKRAYRLPDADCAAQRR